MVKQTLVALVSLVVMSRAAALPAAEDLVEGFTNPPDAAKPWVYWWWLNSNVSREGITRDLEEMKSHGIGGALIFDAGVTDGNYARERIGPAPAGPTFMSDPWRALVKHAAEEADRLGLTLGLNLCSGWNAGGPWITPEYAS